MHFQLGNISPVDPFRLATMIVFSFSISTAYASSYLAGKDSDEIKIGALNEKSSIKRLKEFALHPDRATHDSLIENSRGEYFNLECMNVESRRQCRYILRGSSPDLIKLYSMQITTSSSGDALGAYVTWIVDDTNFCLREKTLNDLLRVTPRTSLPPTYLSFDDPEKDPHRRVPPVLAQPIIYADPKELGKGVVTAFSSDQCIRRIELTTYK